MVDNIKNNNKQKSFFFNDYNESEIILRKQNINIVKVSQSRITFLFFVFLGLIIIFFIKIIYLSSFPEFSEKNLFLEIDQNFIKERKIQIS